MTATTRNMLFGLVAVALLAAVAVQSNGLQLPGGVSTPAGWQQVELDPLVFALPGDFEAAPVTAGQTTWRYAAEGPLDDATGRVTHRVHAAGDLSAHATVDAAVGALTDSYRSYLPGWQLLSSSDRDVAGAQSARLLRFRHSDGPYAAQGATLVIAAGGQVAAVQVVADGAGGTADDIFDSVQMRGN